MNFDRTFCDFWRTCLYGHHCQRALTKKIYEEAKSFGANLSVFIDKPDCFICKYDNEVVVNDND